MLSAMLTKLGGRSRVYTVARRSQESMASYLPHLHQRQFCLQPRGRYRGPGNPFPATPARSIGLLDIFANPQRLSLFKVWGGPGPLLPPPSFPLAKAATRMLVKCLRKILSAFPCGTYQPKVSSPQLTGNPAGVPSRSYSSLCKLTNGLLSQARETVSLSQ